jgi:hypothetical protein
MNAMKNKPKTKPKTKPEPPQEEKGIPRSELDKFLEDEISPEDKKRITNVTVENVFNDNYRANVWMQEYEKDNVCPKVWIGYSYFLRYHEGMIIDKTVEPKLKKKGFFDG